MVHQHYLRPSVYTRDFWLRAQPAPLAHRCSSRHIRCSSLRQPSWTPSLALYSAVTFQALWLRTNMNKLCFVRLSSERPSPHSSPRWRNPVDIVPNWPDFGLHHRRIISTWAALRGVPDTLGSPHLILAFDSCTNLSFSPYIHPS